MTDPNTDEAWQVAAERMAVALSVFSEDPSAVNRAKLAVALEHLEKLIGAPPGVNGYPLLDEPCIEPPD